MLITVGEYKKKAVKKQEKCGHS